MLVKSTKLIEKPGYTQYSYKCTYDCQLLIPNVTDVASVKSKPWVQPGTYKKQKIVDGWTVKVVYRPTKPSNVFVDAKRPGGYRRDLKNVPPKFYVKLHWKLGGSISVSHRNAPAGTDGKCVVRDPRHDFARWNYAGIKKFYGADIVDTSKPNVKEFMGKVTSKMDSINKSAKTEKEK